MSANPSTRDPGLVRLCGWVLGYAWRRWPALVGVSVTTLIKVGLEVLKPWPMVFLVDYVLQHKPMPGWLSSFVSRLPFAQSADQLIGWSVAATLMIFLLGWLVGLAGDYAGISLGQRMVYDLASSLFARLQQLSLRFHASNSVGDSLRRVTADSACVSTILKDALLPLASSLLTLASMFVILWRINVPLTLLSIAVVPYMAWVFWRYARPMLDLSYAQQEIESRVYEIVERTFSAISVVQAFCREPLNDRLFARANRDTLSATMSLTRVQLKFKVLIGLATALGTAAFFWFGGRFALANELSVGTIILFLSYLGSLYAPLEAVMYSNSTIQGAAGSARRVLEILETEQEVREKPGASILARVRGHVKIEDVTFAYEPDRPVLRGVSLEVKPGESLALVGATGAGKSTLASLIPRFFDPHQGRVLIDGRDVRDLTLRSLRDQVALVLQEPFLFPLSVAGNIAYGRPDATMAEIESAARTARAEAFIRRLPQGYETVVGERGATLSVGQRQRLSIARALLKGSPILILDEPTSALDAETEHLLLEALAELMKRHTTFIIAHRLSTARRATRIAFLADGVVAEVGTHEELLALGGLYARFHQLQFGLVDGGAERKANSATTQWEGRPRNP